MTQLDIQLFRLINNSAGHSPTLDWLGVFMAHWMLWLMLASLLALAAVPVWRSRQGLCRVCRVFGRGRRRREEPAVLAAYAAVVAMLAAAMAWLGNQAFGLLVVSRTRPFVTLESVRLLISPPLTAKSFPSDHSTIAFAMAFAVVLMRPRLGLAFLAAAALVAWGRVFVGVHYPADVAAGLVVGLLWALAAKMIESRTGLTRRLCRGYERICHWLADPR